MRDVGEQRAERHDQLDAERLGELDDRAQKVRQRIDGSGPDSRIRSRGARGACAAQISISGQIDLARAALDQRTVGRVAWKS